MKTLFITSLVWLTACGSADKGAPETVAVSEQQNSPQHALYVADEASVPPCTNEALGWLIYVSNAEEFRTCQEDGWEIVEIRGRDGENGKDGANGRDGTDGLAGADGEDGLDGAPEYGWIDPLTDLHWVQMTGTWNQTTALTLCTGGYTLPSATELFDAGVHGLTTALPIGNGTDVSLGWASEAGTAVRIQPTVASPQASSTANPYSVYCVGAL